MAFNAQKFEKLKLTFGTFQEKKKKKEKTGRTVKSCPIEFREIDLSILIKLNWAQLFFD